MPLKGLMEAPKPRSETGEARVDTGRPRYSGGAIGAVSQSIAGLKSRSVLEIDPDQIEAGGLRDRLDFDEADHQALMVSIRDHGQQVPVLLRPHPDRKDRYQVVYGRRRVLALRDLGQPVKALVRDLDDRELILAQGQENAARRDLSFIEKANFARQMRDQGYERSTICAALHIDKTLISRMLSVVDRLSPDLIEAIGAAPSVGRDRWLTLAERIETDVFSVDEAIATVNLARDGSSSDARFEALFKAIERHRDTPGRKPPASDTPLKGAAGETIGQALHRSGTTLLKLPDKTAPGFAEWLIAALPDLHHRWKDGDDG
ncbi:chromosome-partitioning protein ParB [Roseovarius sp. A-2]|uniref:plasmid partitioning protein RepB n=1 Tax=Roseovarius sp. A-2 TaxID=1570360 RepID=UPI0009B532ED|nr:plasmid partitioning protein RepB [Roseovarius sp. A-2]GAW37438.1 chromosome-partitioning protein ParB [Roseovarius sp. A-2]